MREGTRSDLVLVGGGHAHVQVIRRWMRDPVPGVRLTVVLDRAEAVYSGMVPGFVAGDYAAHELEIDGVPLARRAGARVILDPATRIDPDARRIHLTERPPLAYDVASLDVGSTVRGRDAPGVRDHALATRPIRGFIDRLEARLEGAGAPGRALRVVVVGGGAAGSELAFTLEARLRASGRVAHVALVSDDAELLPGAHRRFAARLARAAAARGIALHPGRRVGAVEPEAVLLEDPEERLACDLAVWATGAAPPGLVARSPLPHDAAGFVRTGPTLQVEGHARLFAVGDCAALTHAPWVPKAGVYAVRQGPQLDANLRALLRGGRLRPYRPQRDFLALLNLGDGRALGAKWGVVAEGRAVFRLKDWIDRRFVRRFQVLGPEGAPQPDFAEDAMAGEPMDCGGCAAKLDARSLGRALARLPAPPPDDSVRVGLAEADDVAAVRTPGGETWLSTVDGFPAFTDDPWLVGRVAAQNAVSDVFAKGGRPIHVLALVTVPESDAARAEETLVQVLAGVRATLDPLGASLVGGHTTRGEALFVALSVTGALPPGEAMLPLAGARPGDALVLTRPLGTGAVLAAHMRGLAPGRWWGAALASMVRANGPAARVARDCGARACTDVSGFGLAGHAAELLRAAGVAAELDPGALPALPGALALLARGVRSTFHDGNERALEAEVAADGDARRALLFDPQTSGGLLMAMPPERADEALGALHAAGDEEAARIGRVVPARSGTPRLALRR